jgi:hypothetical protein
MSVQLEETKRMAAKLQKECEEYLVVIVQQRQEANDQAKQISAKSEKIEAEENDVKQEGMLSPLLAFFLFPCSFSSLLRVNSND